MVEATEAYSSEAPWIKINFRTKTRWFMVSGSLKQCVRWVDLFSDQFSVIEICHEIRFAFNWDESTSVLACWFSLIGELSGLNFSLCKSEIIITPQKNIVCGVGMQNVTCSLASHLPVSLFIYSHACFRVWKIVST